MYKLAILHYHLNRGGVSQVIANQLRALDAEYTGGGLLQVALVYGGRAEDWPGDELQTLQHLDVTYIVVPELEYDALRPRARGLTASVSTALEGAGFAPGETVLHIHNHALGKNTALPQTVGQLAERGYACLLHIHDFAEDNRPENYRALMSGPSSCLYPQANNIHYAVLNSRDFHILKAAGVPSMRLHSLPNAVGELGTLSDREEARRKLSEVSGLPRDGNFVLYPVRGIRRKNLGEALLWSLLAESGTRFALTLPATSVAEVPAYERWKALAGELSLPWLFELGLNPDLSFLDNVAAADRILTTSVAEGFGLVFLEAALADRMLIGRDLPEITEDFVQSGMRFPGLRPTLMAPLSLLDETLFRQEFAQTYVAALDAYGRSVPPPETMNALIDGLVLEGCVDLAHCGPHTQAGLIRRTASDEACRAELRALNPGLSAAVSLNIDVCAPSEENASIVRREYGLAHYGQRLLDLYDRVASSDRAGGITPPERGEAILEAFLNPSRLCPILSSL